jgi:hypothetical protein
MRTMSCLQRPRQLPRFCVRAARCVRARMQFVPCAPGEQLPILLRQRRGVRRQLSVIKKRHDPRDARLPHMRRPGRNGRVTDAAIFDRHAVVARAARPTRAEDGAVKRGGGPEVGIIAERRQRGGGRRHARAHRALRCRRGAAEPRRRGRAAQMLGARDDLVHGHPKAAGGAGWEQLLVSGTGIFCV